MLFYHGVLVLAGRKLSLSHPKPGHMASVGYLPTPPSLEIAAEVLLWVQLTHMYNPKGSYIRKEASERVPGGNPCRSKGRFISKKVPTLLSSLPFVHIS